MSASMAAFQPSVSALASRGGTDLAKFSWPRGNTHDEPQAATWQGGATPQQRACAEEKGLSGGARPQLEAATARSNKNEKKGGAEPDSDIPSEVVDKIAQVREARGTHRRRYSVQEVD